MNEPRQQMTDFQKEVNTTVESFWQAAQGKRGRVMGEREVRHVATYIVGLTEGIMELENRLAVSANMLAAYINEYGEELMETLLTEDVVEAEVVNADEENESVDEGTGMDASVEGQEQGTIPETTRDEPSQ